MPDWISAISAALLGIAGLGFAIWQWHATGFHPKITAELDASKDAIRLRIRNRGRGPGVISEVAVVDPRGVDITWTAIFNGFPDGQFSSTRLPGMDLMQIIIEAPETKKFEPTQCVFVEWGKSKQFPLRPVDVGFFGLSSVLPPQQAIS
jgi:hypothetical protein